jgi:hypothetical protein
MSTDIVKANGDGTGTIERQGFGSREVEKRGETAATAMAAQARAEIEAAYVMAMQRPRDDDNVRVRLLRDCKRPGFAARAYYSVPRGDKPGRLTGTPRRIEGLSVRYAEAAIRHSGNILQQSKIIFDSVEARIVTVIVRDLETNAIFSSDIEIEKTIERKKTKDGDVVLGTRTNSAGDLVHIIQAPDAEILVKQSAMVSRTFRTLALRLVPPDTIEECERAIMATVKEADAKDPDAARKAIADTFASVNVLPSDLKEYLGCDLAQASPAQLTELRGLFSAIRDGDVTWADALAEKTDGEIKGGGVKSVAEKLAERAASKATGAAQGTPSSTATSSPATSTAPPTNDAPKTEPCFHCTKPVGPEGVDHEDSEGVVHRKHRECVSPATKTPGN